MYAQFKSGRVVYKVIPPKTVIELNLGTLLTLKVKQVKELLLEIIIDLKPMVHI